MLKRENILSLEYLKKTEYTGSHQGMRYRLESVDIEKERTLKVTIWPEPLNYIMTPDTEKRTKEFVFSEDGIVDAIAWMNDRLFEEK